MAISENPDIPAATEMEAEIREVFNLSPGPETVCFYCLEPVAHPVIYWEGHARIWLHADCALGLTAGLLADVRRLRDLEHLRDNLRDRIGA